MNLKDRKLQVRKRNSISIDLYDEKFITVGQATNSNEVTHPDDYLYSSSNYYYNRENRFEML